MFEMKYQYPSKHINLLIFLKLKFFRSPNIKEITRKKATIDQSNILMRKSVIKSQIPLFVKVHSQGNEQFNQKSLLNLWNKPSAKQFHLIDCPSLSFKLAQQLSSSKNQKQNLKRQQIQPRRQTNSINRRSFIYSKGKKNKERIKYANLSQELSKLGSFIQHQAKDIHLSQVLQYKQNMLSSFLDKFFNDLNVQCHERAQLMQGIWNQFSSLFNRFFTQQCKSQKNNEKNSLCQTLSLHKSYQAHLLNIKSQNSNLQSLTTNLKLLIKSLVFNIRQKQSQIYQYEDGFKSYKNKVYQMGNRMEQLEKEVMDLLRYGTVGNLTKQMADQLLFEVVKHQDHQMSSGCLITNNTIPRISQIIKTFQQLDIQQTQHYQSQHPLKKKTQVQTLKTIINTQTQKRLRSPQQIRALHLDKQLSDFQSPIQLPKVLLLNRLTQVINSSIQTQNLQTRLVKLPKGIDCSYFTKLNDQIIKNKIVQTQHSRISLRHQETQTFTYQDYQQHQDNNNQPQDYLYKRQFQCRLDSMVMNLVVCNQSVVAKSQYNIHTTKNEQKLQHQKRDTIQITLQKTPQINLLSKKPHIKPSQPQIIKRISVKRKLPQSKTQTIQKVSMANQSYKPYKTENDQEDRTVSNKKRKNLPITKAKKAELRMIWFRQEGDEQIKNSCINSGQIVQLIQQLFNTRSKLAQGEQTSCKSYCTLARKNNQLSWPYLINDVLLACKTRPERIQIFNYYNKQAFVNHNLTKCNKLYLPSHLYLQKSFQRRSTLNLPKTQFSSQFTIKKCMKIIFQVYDICIQMRTKSPQFQGYNFVTIIQQLVGEDNVEREVGKIDRKVKEFYQNIAKMQHDNYLFKNFLFLSGFDPTKPQRNQLKFKTHPKTSQNSSKVDEKIVHISTIIEDHSINNANQKNQDEKILTMIYSSDVVFYLDMLAKLKYQQGKDDQQSMYTTYERLQACFDMISKYYIGSHKLLKWIKQVIKQPFKQVKEVHPQKLNLFKSLQLILSQISSCKREIYLSLLPFSQELSLHHDFNYHLILANILSLIPMTKSTQLKILDKSWRMFQNMGLEDFVQVYFMEGLPDLQRIRVGLLKDRKTQKLINDNYKSIKTPTHKQDHFNLKNKPQNHMELTSSIVDYIVDNHQFFVLKDSKQEKIEIHNTIFTKQFIQNYSDHIIGQHLSLINMYCTVIDTEKWNESFLKNSQ